MEGEGRRQSQPHAGLTPCTAIIPRTALRVDAWKHGRNAHCVLTPIVRSGWRALKKERRQVPPDVAKLAIGSNSVNKGPMSRLTRGCCGTQHVYALRSVRVSSTQREYSTHPSTSHKSRQRRLSSLRFNLVFAVAPVGPRIRDPRVRNPVCNES